MNLKGTLVLLILSQGTLAFSQFRNQILGEVGSHSRCAVSVAVNPRQPVNIVAVTQENVFVTKDGGDTWQKNKLASYPGGPALLADDKGNYVFFHLLTADTDASPGNRMSFQRSSDGGDTWTSAEMLELESVKHQQLPWATVDGKGNLYATWTQSDQYDNPDPACKSSIVFSMSKNGKKWSDPVVIADGVGNCMPGGPAGPAIPTVTFDGKVIIAWCQNDKILLDRSFNGGEWWLSNDIVVADLKQGANMVIPGHGERKPMPVLTTDISKSPFRGSLYLVWADQRKGENDTDIWFSRSHNFGDNWSLPSRVNDDSPGKHQYMPWMAVDQSTGYIYILYYDRRNHDGDQTDVYLAWSADGGASFTNTVVSTEPFTPVEEEFAAYNSISAHKGIINPVWSRTDNGKVSVWTATIKQEDLVK